MIRLQRLVYDYRADKRKKISTSLRFPSLLNTDVLGVPASYDLIGLVAHKGAGALSGHYVAYVKDPNGFGGGGGGLVRISDARNVS